MFWQPVERINRYIVYLFFIDNLPRLAGITSNYSGSMPTTESDEWEQMTRRSFFPLPFMMMMIEKKLIAATNNTFRYSRSPLPRRQGTFFLHAMFHIHYPTSRCRRRRALPRLEKKSMNTRHLALDRDIGVVGAPMPFCENLITPLSGMF